MNFAKLENSILTVLRQATVALALEILPGVLSLGSIDSGSPIIYINVPDRPGNGVWIGADGESTNAGSLGEWLLLRRPNLPSQKIFLTVFRLLNPKSSPLHEHSIQRGIHCEDQAPQKPDIQQSCHHVSL